MNKRVLIIIPSLTNGGAERIASYLLTGLPENWRVDLILCEKKIDYACRENSRIFVTGTGISGIIRRFKLLRSFKKSGEYDIYNSHMASSNILNIFSGKKSGKLVLTIHAVTSIQMKEQKLVKLINLIIKKFYPRADKIVAVSDAVKQDLCKNYGINPEKIDAIDNGNDIENIYKLRKIPLDESDKKNLNGHPCITAMGRYTPAKGHIPLIKSFAEVAEKYPDARLIIIGEGELRGQYEALIKELDLDKNVVLTGYRKNPFQLIHNSDLFVFSSIYEGYGCALAEAMFCSVPVVAVDCPGVVGKMMKLDGECLKPVSLESGVVCPSFERSENAKIELAESIIKLYENREYAEKCVEFNEKRADEFSISGMLDKWTAMLEKM